MSEIRPILYQASEQRDIAFTHDDFTKIARIVHQEAGIALPAAKESLVYSRLAKRLRELGLKSFRQYVNLLSSAVDGDEMDCLVSALTTNTTHFMREKHHFDILAETVLPPLVAAARKGARVRLWSAACSSGEEAYGMAFALLDQCPEAGSLDLKILATDIDTQILALAEQGAYLPEQLTKLPEHQIENYFDGKVGEGGLRHVVASARALISFRQMNLIRPWPVRRVFDVVFCRNVAMYFDQAAQDKIWRCYADILQPNGYLFLGHSERLSASVRRCFMPVGMTVFRRNSELPISVGVPIPISKEKRNVLER